jgi:hypothetical protein
MRKTTTAIFTLASALFLLSITTFAKDYSEVPNDLQAFLRNVHQLSVLRDVESLKMCVMPFFGMRAYGDTFTRKDFDDAVSEDYVREFRHESEGMTDFESMKLTEFLFGEYSCFGLLANKPFEKGILVEETELFDEDMCRYYEQSRCDYFAFETESYDNGDIVYCVAFSMGETQWVSVGKIEGKWYVLAFDPWE